MTVQDSLNESDAIAENIKSRPSVGGEKSKKKGGGGGGKKGGGKKGVGGDDCKGD